MTQPDPAYIARIVESALLRSEAERADFIREASGGDEALRLLLESALNEEALDDAPVDPEATLDASPEFDPGATLDIPDGFDPEATLDVPADVPADFDPDATLDVPPAFDEGATLDLPASFEGDETVGLPKDMDPEATSDMLPGDYVKTPESKSASGIPSQIGDFRIIGMLGEGGMGAVYLAEQLHPRRRVALKVIRARIISANAIKRFEIEGETLAKLSHPNVAQVFAAGIDQIDGQSMPFFAMEYIEHASELTDWAREKKLSFTERLELFAVACEALAHAHQRGIIHRDLKPGNVLVGGEGQVKVIDFGVAQVESDDTDLEMDRQIVGTLQYMPPEQVRGELDIDTSCDVYAFGVVLYELMADEPPYEIDTRSLKRAITSVIESPEPSLIDVVPELGRDLDAIIRKSLAKDRSIRYASAGELAQDIRRYLNDEPVTAREQTASEMIRRFRRKYRVLTSAALAVVFVIVLGLVGVSVFAYRAEVARGEEFRQRQLAVAATQKVEKERERLEKIVDFQSSMIESLDPSEMGNTLRDEIVRSTQARLENSDASADDIEIALADQEWSMGMYNPTEVAIGLIDKHVLQGALKTVPEKFKSDEATESDVREIVADAYLTLGLYKQASPEFERALELRQVVFGPDDPRTIEAVSDLGLLRLTQADYIQAKSLLETALERRTRVLGREHPETIASLQNLGKLSFQSGEFAKARATWEEAYGSSLKTNGENHPISVILMGNLGAVLIQMGEFTEAENYIRREYELSKVMYGNDSVDIYPIEQNLAEIQIQLGDIDSAAALLENVVQGYKRQLGDRHPDTLGAISSFALIKMRHQGQIPEAISLLIEAVDGQSATLGEFHPQTFDSLQLLAQGYLMAGDPVGFGPVATRAHAAAIELFGESADTTLAWLQARALVARDSGQFAKSERILGELETICADAETLGATGQQVCDTVPTLFVSLYDKWHEAEPQSNHDLSAVRWREQIKGDDAPVN